MESNKELSQKTPKQIEIERLRAFPTATYDPSRPTGVLLSDEIENYCEKFWLLKPYERANIKPANYELRVGHKYSLGGKTHELKNMGDVLRIPPFEVVVVEILETINMPAFLIGRWNIRVRWAYDGLIWVGGPQVDAGYRGRISCPIWNLSNNTIPIKCGEEIAIIDFVTTTPPTENSKLYEWEKRSRFVFEDYEPDKLMSALVTKVNKDIEDIKAQVRANTDEVDSSLSKTEDALERSNTRIDTTTSVMFTAFGVLVAAIAIFATKPPEAVHYWWDPTIFFLCWTTTALSLFAWVRFQSKDKWAWTARLLVAVLILSGIILQVVYARQQANDMRNAIDQLRQQVHSMSPGRHGPATE